MKKEIAGQPVWLWMLGAGAVVLGYLYFKSRSSQQPGQQGGQGGRAGTATGGGQYSFKEWITQHQGPPGRPPPPAHPGPPARKPPPRKNPGGRIGPEREWLIHKTGANHPWTFLSQHHEQIRVGPEGSRKIIGRP